MSPYQPTHEFEQHVGLAVDPIPASPNRKRSMREELLAHLHGAFEQELADSRPPEIALATAMHRFGNLDLIRTELRQSVPLLERIIFQFLAPVFTPREPLMLRWSLVGIACFFIGMGIILPALAKIRDQREITVGAVIPGSIGLAIVIIGVAASIYRVYKLSRNRSATPR